MSTTIAGRIGSGELKSGMPIEQGALASEIGTRHYIQAAIEQLVRTGERWTGLSRRIPVVASSASPAPSIDRYLRSPSPSGEGL